MTTELTGTRGGPAASPPRSRDGAGRSAHRIWRGRPREQWACASGCGREGGTARAAADQRVPVEPSLFGRWPRVHTDADLIGAAPRPGDGVRGRGREWRREPLPRHLGPARARRARGSAPARRLVHDAPALPVRVRRRLRPHRLDPRRQPRLHAHGAALARRRAGRAAAAVQSTTVSRSGRGRRLGSSQP